MILDKNKILLFLLVVFSNEALSDDSIKRALASMPNCVPRIEQKRLSSAPYISSDTYRLICNHVCDEVLESIVNPSNVKQGDTVFVNPIFLDYFFKNIHPFIENPYILVSIGHDISTPGKFFDKLHDDNLFHWFGANGDINHHSKFTHIPIGLSTVYYPHGNIEILGSVIDKVNKKIIVKNKLVGLNFIISTNKAVRAPIWNYFHQKKYVSNLKCTNFNDYLINMAECNFIISPHGNGLDCHRTWEAIWVGTYPIVKESTLDYLYKDLPVVIVKNWSDITENFLHEKIKELISIGLKNKFRYEKMFFAYYHDLINSKKTECMNLKGIKNI